MTKRNGVISCSLFLLLTITFDNAAAKSAEVSAISLDVLRVKACAVGQGCSTVGGPKQWNLFDLADGKTDFANQVLMPAKTHELRLMLGSKSTITVDGQTYPLTVPSGQVSGLKLKGNKVFASANGFLKSIRLNFDPAKGLVVQAKKVKGKGKKDKDTLVYSYSLKPVIQVSSAEVTPMPENMAGVFVMPDESSKLTLGKDFLLSIPVGAVSAPVLVTVEEAKNYVEYFDALTQQLATKPDLASTYTLIPEGFTFSKPLQLNLRYNDLALIDKFTINDLTIRHNGHKVETLIDIKKQIATGAIDHFSKVTVSTYTGECTEEKIGPSNGGSPIKYFDCKKDNGYPRMHVVVVDRTILANEYELRVLAHNSSKKDGRFKTERVEHLANEHRPDAIVAINGNTFKCKEENSESCYEGEDGSYPTRTTVMNGILKQLNKNDDVPEVALGFGGLLINQRIPIKYLTKSDIKDGFEDTFGVSFQEAKSQLEAGNIENTSRAIFGTSMYWMLGSHQAARKKGTCPFVGDTGGNNLGALVDSEESIIGYNDAKIIFLASQLGDTFNTYKDSCEAMRIFDSSDAILMDEGRSVQLVVDGKIKNAANNSDTRHVVNAVGLVRKGQDDDDGGDDDSDDDGNDNTESIKIEEDQARCGGTDEYWHKQDVGSGGKSLWTYNNDSSHGVDNYCTYEFDKLERGKKWEVKVFIPSNHATTSHACYEISDGGMPIGAEVDQYPVYDDWVSLGVFKAEGDFLKVSLTDWTDHEGYGDHSVGFDAIKIVPAPEDAEVGRHDGVGSCEPRL